MSNREKAATIDKFLLSVETVKKEGESVLCGIEPSTVEEHAAAIQDLVDKVTAEYEEQESVLDEDEEGAIDRLEALENVKDELTKLTEKMEEFATFLANLSDSYEEIEESLKSAKEGL